MAERPLLRPEARAALLRGREALAGLALAALSAWAWAASFGLLRWLAAGGVAAGLLLAWTGAQRWRFRAARAEPGPGVVRVDERRVEYWGPFGGGFLDLGDLARLDCEPAARPARWWLIDASGGALAVPVTAAGAEALFDALAALPGMRVEAMLAALGRAEAERVTLWRAPRALERPR